MGTRPFILMFSMGYYAHSVLTQHLKYRTIYTNSQPLNEAFRLFGFHAFWPIAGKYSSGLLKFPTCTHVWPALGRHDVCINPRTHLHTLTDSSMRYACIYACRTILKRCPLCSYYTPNSCLTPPGLLRLYRLWVTTTLTDIWVACRRRCFANVWKPLLVGAWAWPCYRIGPILLLLVPAICCISISLTLFHSFSRHPHP